jgi:hypothetical protein
MPPFLATRRIATPFRRGRGEVARQSRARAQDPLGDPLERVAIILRANKESSELGGHIASFQSSALLYDIGFGHFWHAPTKVTAAT